VVDSTSDAVKGMLAKPENREEAVAKLFQSVGGKLIAWYLTFGHHDWLAIGEFPDAKAAASAVLAAAGGGSLSDVETTIAMTAKEAFATSNLLQRQQRPSGAPGVHRFAKQTAQPKQVGFSSMKWILDRIGRLTAVRSEQSASGREPMSLAPVPFGACRQARLGPVNHRPSRRGVRGWGVAAAMTRISSGL